eukprot:3099227-Rhodomonas_salina.3
MGHWVGWEGRLRVWCNVKCLLIACRVGPCWELTLFIVVVDEPEVAAENLLAELRVAVYDRGICGLSGDVCMER